MPGAAGYVFRYYADPKDKYFCDGGPLADPDFFTNRINESVIPTWAVCGPYVRQKLRVGDLVFFVPSKRQLNKGGISDYICTGILTVGEILEDKKDAMVHPRLNRRFTELYLKDLRKHLRNDPLRTKKIRPKRIILGDPANSLWFGRNDKYLREAFAKLGISSFPKLTRSRTPLTL